MRIKAAGCQQVIWCNSKVRTQGDLYSPCGSDSQKSQAFASLSPALQLNWATVCIYAGCFPTTFCYTLFAWGTVNWQRFNCKTWNCVKFNVSMKLCSHLTLFLFFQDLYLALRPLISCIWRILWNWQTHPNWLRIIYLVYSVVTQCKPVMNCYSG